MEHRLKSWPENFGPVKNGIKKAEVRLNDRQFELGDLILLEEWSPVTRLYTGESVKIKVTHIVKDFDGLQNNYVVLSFERI